MNNATNAIVMFKVGPVHCCASCEPVDSIILPPHVTQAPGSSELSPGIFRHNNRITRLIDLRQKFGIPDEDRKKPGRIIVIQAGMQDGFWVDEIIDVIQRPTQGWGITPSYIPRDLFSATLLYKDQIYLYTEFKNFNLLKDFGFLKRFISPTPTQNDVSDLQQATTATGKNGDRETDMEGRPLLIINPTPSALMTSHSKPDTNIQAGEGAHTNSDAKVTAIKPESCDRAARPKQAKTETARPTRPMISGKTGIEIKSIDNTTKPASPALAAKHKVEINTDSKNSSSQNHDQPALKKIPEKPANNNWNIFLMLITTVSISLFLFFEIYSRITHDEIRTTKVITTTEIPIKVKPDFSVAIEHQAEHKPDNKDLPVDALIENNPSEKKSKLLPQPVQIKERSRILEKPDTQPSTTQTEQHAIIRRDKAGIVIELNPPAEKKTMSTMPDQPAALDNDKRNLPVDGHASMSDNAVAIKTKTEKIEHIVIKGDTLWDIAERYVKNPFLYPELARLSKIKNPDLIYPGDRVLIIRHFHSQ